MLRGQAVLTICPASAGNVAHCCGENGMNFSSGQPWQE